MATITKFEELECWILARSYAAKVYRSTTKEILLNGFGFQDQIRRAAISVMNNIAEGFGRFSKKEFKRFLDIALGSLNETRSMTYIANDLGYLDDALASELLVENELIKSKILGLIKYLNTIINK